MSAKLISLGKCKSHLKSSQVKLTIPGELKELLDYYCQAYKEAYDETIDIKDLILELVRSKIDSDAAFQKYLKGVEAAVKKSEES